MRHRIWALLLVLASLLAGVRSASVDRYTLRQAERHLLAMFGLQKRPPPSNSSAILSGYVKSLYENQKKAGSSDTIRCYKGRDIGIRNACDPLRVKYIFDLNSIPDTETLMAAELVLYREAERTYSRPPVHRVQVHDIVRPMSRTSDSILRLLDTRVFKGSNKSAWETFDVLPAVKRWLQEPSQNFGLHIQLASSLNATEPQSVRLKRSIGEEHFEWSQYEPLLVIYSKDPNSKSTSVLSRTKRSNHRRNHRRKGRRDNCRRHALYVDFSDVAWDDWIIAPPGYNAYFCHGDCPFPLPDHLNATNHAIVQTLVNSANPAAVPRACCVPTELSSISLLYKDQHDVVMLKNYQDMVVEGCGCR